MDRIFILAALLLGIANACGITAAVPNSAAYGFFLLAGSAGTAWFLLKRDRTPEHGTVLFVTALVVTSVQLLGGGYSPAAFVYPLVFIWMRKSCISGPVLVAASSMALVEFFAPMAAATGLFTGSFDAGGILRVITDALVAGVIPLVSLFLVEFLEEERHFPVSVPPEKSGTAEDRPVFPDDVARSLIPVLKRSTDAGGIFLFTGDRRGGFTLNEFVSSSGSVSGRYITGPDDPAVRLLESSREDIMHTEAEKLSIGGCRGLPWYLDDSGSEWVTLVQFRRDGYLHGFLVLDFDSRDKRAAAAPILVDSSFLLAVAWERSRQTGTGGFLAICEDMSGINDVRGAVHRLVSRILKTWPDTTASVAILGEGGVLRVFESLGSLSEGRAGREFGLKDGFAGLAVTRREPMRRLRMGMGQKAVRTYGSNDCGGSLAGSCCAVPLEDRGAVLGILTVESVSEQFFAPEDLQLLKAFATVFSLAVSRRNLQDTLAVMKENDRLTGFPLLSSFHARLNDMVRGVRARAWSITVLAVDISGFSKINEVFGYDAGDKVLEKTADRLRKAVGEKAVFARSGADSFLICLQEVDRVSAEAFAARIQEEFADSPIIAADREIPISVCIGGAVSHVDKMIRKLPGIASEIVESISGKPGLTTITEVDQFFEMDRYR